jgi:hypothetical protein
MSDATISIGYNLDQLRADAVKAEAITREMGKKAQAASGGGFFAGKTEGILDAAAGLAVVATLHKIGEEFGHVADQADKLNTSAEVIQRLTHMGDPVGVDIDTMVKSLTKLNRALMDGSNIKAGNALSALGVSAGELIKMEPDQQIIALNHAFQEAQSSGKGFTEIFDLMGKSASDLIPLLRMSKEEMDDIASMNVVSDEDVANIDALGDAWSHFQRKTTAAMASMIMTAPKFYEAMSAGMFALGAGESFNDAFKSIGESQKAAAKEADEAAQKKREMIKQAQAERKAELDYQEMHKVLLDNPFAGSEDQHSATEKSMEKILRLSKELSLFSSEGRHKIGSDKTELENLKEHIELTQKLAAARKEAQTEALRLENIVKMQRGKKEGTQNELDELRIEELKNSRRFAAADKLEKERKQRMNEQKIRDANPGMNDADVKARAQRMRNIEDRKSGIIGRTTLYHAPEKDWGLDHRGGSALDAFGMKGRLDLAAKMGESHLGARGPLGRAAAASDAAAHKATESTSLVVLNQQQLQELKRVGDLLAA